MGFEVNRSQCVGHRLVLSYKWMWNVKSWYLGQNSLVVRVSVRAGAGLAVLWGANGRVTEEARGALLAELTLCVMQTALAGETYRV